MKRQRKPQPHAFFVPTTCGSPHFDEPLPEPDDASRLA